MTEDGLWENVYIETSKGQLGKPNARFDIVTYEISVELNGYLYCAKQAFEPVDLVDNISFRFFMNQLVDELDRYIYRKKSNGIVVRKKRIKL